MSEHQKSGMLIQMDETRIQVLKEPGYVAQGNKYMWVILGGPPKEPVVIFDYDPSRGHEVPLRLLDGYEGRAIALHKLQNSACSIYFRLFYVEEAMTI